jgi:hypothetical protein
MTTFTSDDREEEYKKILKETQALEKGLKFFKKLKGDNASPPHIVDSGASVMKDEPVAYINVEERKLEWAKPMTWHTPTIAQMDKIPLYTHQAKTLTDEEIKAVYGEYFDVENCDWLHLQCIQAILRKAQEK